MQAIDGVETLSVEGRPADEEGDDDSNCNQKNRAALEGWENTARGELGGWLVRAFVSRLFSVGKLIVAY